MKADIREYAKIGFVHHMLYPACRHDPDDHERTLGAFVQWADMETFDCCLPDGAARRARLVRAIRQSGKSGVAFAMHLFPFHKLSVCTPVPSEQAQVRLLMRDMVAQAAAMGATGFIFASGGPPPAAATPSHYESFADFCRWLCAALKPHGMTALLEPFDTMIDKKFLYGSTASCAALIEALRPHVDNLGIELDVAHLPLMGERFEQAIANVAPYLQRVHLGNCILKNRMHPLYGDKHPPIGFEGGEIDVPEISVVLDCLLKAGYLNRKHRGALIIENTPWPGKTVEETIKDSLKRVAEAWSSL